MLMRFVGRSAFNLASYSMFMECSWGVQPVLGVIAFSETTEIEVPIF